MYVDANKTEDYQWFLPVRSRTKRKNEKKKKRQEKNIQKAENEKITSCSSGGDTTVTDDEVN